MATSNVSRGVPSAAPPPPPSHWRDMWYRNAAVEILGHVFAVSEDDAGSDDDQEIELQLSLNMSMPSTTPPSSSRIPEGQFTYADIPLSQLRNFRDLISGLVVDHPFLDDGYARFLVNWIDFFARVEERRFSDWLGRIPSTVWIQVDVLVTIGRMTLLMPQPPPPRPAPVPQLEKVAYEEGGAAGVSETACPICLQDFQTGEEVGRTPCGHPFHPTCVGRWFEQNPLCPICRRLVPGI